MQIFLLWFVSDTAKSAWQKSYRGSKFCAVRIKSHDNYAVDDDLSCIHGYRVGELEHTWLVEMEWLQWSLQEEGERREAAERALEELKGEVSIGMEDLSLSPSPERESNGERNMGVWKSVCMCLWERGGCGSCYCNTCFSLPTCHTVHYFNVARAWVQGFIKNPK